MRTHRVRPSEKIASGLISGSSPEGPLPRDGLAAEGRAPHAHKDTIGFPRACLH